MYSSIFASRFHGIFLLTSLAILVVGLVGCSGTATSPESGRLRIQLVDNHGPFDAVFIDIVEVSVHLAAVGDTSGGEWLAISGGASMHDLLKLRNGVTAELGNIAMPAGHYTQIRLLLGDGSRVVVDGTSWPLTVPSGMQTGLKLIHDFDVTPGGFTELTLDFDAERSVVRTGNGRYLLKPTVRVIASELAGAIQAHILPDSVAATVRAIAGADIVQTTATEADGFFRLGPLPAGSYDVAIDAVNMAHRDTVLTGVWVVAGEVNDLGDIRPELEQGGPVLISP